VQLPTEQGYRDKKMNTPVRLREADGTVVTSGALLPDRAECENARANINSRQEAAPPTVLARLFIGRCCRSWRRGRRRTGRFDSTGDPDAPDLRDAFRTRVRILREGTKGELGS